MAISVLYFQTVIPEYANLNPSFIQFYITEASKYVNARVWREKTDYAIALYTAHLIKLILSAQKGGSGVLQAETSGDLSHSFAVPNNQKIALTSYGTLFYELMGTLDDIGPRVLI